MKREHRNTKNDTRFQYRIRICVDRNATTTATFYALTTNEKKNRRNNINNVLNWLRTCAYAHLINQHLRGASSASEKSFRLNRNVERDFHLFAYSINRSFRTFLRNDLICCLSNDSTENWNTFSFYFNFEQWNEKQTKCFHSNAIDAIRERGKNCFFWKSFIINLSYLRLNSALNKQSLRFVPNSMKI